MNFNRYFFGNISFPIMARKEGLGGVKNRLKGLEESQYWAPDRLQEYQSIKLKNLCIHAFENTSFYRKRFHETGFNPYRFSLDDFNKLPVLDKQDVRLLIKQLIAKNFSPKDLHFAESGGTTGVKLIFYRNNKCLTEKEAALFRFEKWAGWNFGDRIGLIWPATQDITKPTRLRSILRNELFLRYLVFPTTTADEFAMNQYINLLRSKKPSIIRGFTSLIYEIARYINLTGIEDIQIKGIITTGETLYPHQRAMLEKSFHGKVFDSYRTREAGPIAQECEYHDGMHINVEGAYLQIIPHDQLPFLDSGLGEVIITDLHNYGMPLIRYKIGDLGSVSNQRCPCGRGMPILKTITGRTVDILFSPDKKRISGSYLVVDLIARAPGEIGQVQVIQDRLDHLLIKLTNNPQPNNITIDYQREVIKKLFGENMHVSFEIVSDIPREGSGKHVFTKCLLKEADLT